jgi:hypothetical protein
MFSITDGTMFGMLGAIAISTSDAAPLASSYKLHSVQAWANPTTLGNPVIVSLRWESTNFNPQSEISDSTGSATRPAHIHAVPPAGSGSSFWRGGSDNLCDIVAPTGATVDLDVSYVMYDGVTPTQFTGATTGGGSLTAGVLYYSTLDGTTDSNPVGLTPFNY